MIEQPCERVRRRERVSERKRVRERERESERDERARQSRGRSHGRCWTRMRGSM